MIYWQIDKFTPYSASLKAERGIAKNTAAKILSSDLPVDDILIDEVEIDDVIRKIFNAS